jgi:hypothetical protein
LDTGNWGFKAPCFINIDKDYRINRSEKFTLRNGNIVYLLAENRRSLPLNSFTELLKMVSLPSMTERGEEKLLCVGDIPVPEVGPAMPITLTFCGTLKDYKVVIQYTTTSNLILIHYQNVKTVLSPSYMVLFYSSAVQKVFAGITFTDKDEFLFQAVRARVAQNNERFDSEMSLNYSLERHSKTIQELK